MNAVFYARNGERIVVGSDWGYVVAELTNRCDLDAGEIVSGVRRDHGPQVWWGGRGSRCEVNVVAFDVGYAWTIDWLVAG